MSNGLLLARGLVQKDLTFHLDLDAHKVRNPHLLLVGGSGVGKTTLMLSAIEEMRLKGKTLFVIDFHGDMEIAGENHIKYTPRNSPFGVNPFEIEKNEESGGIKMQTEVIALMLGSYFIDKLGKKQENILKRLIQDTYSFKGMIDDDVSTWDLEPPTMSDLYLVSNYVKNMIDAEEEESRDVIQLERLNNLMNSFSPKDLESLKEKLDGIESYIRDGKCDEALDKIDLSYYRHSSIKRTFDSLYVYLEEICTMGIFNGATPRLIRGVNRLDFSAFTQVNKPLIARFLAEFTAQKLFRASMASGHYNQRDGDKFNRVLVFDESKLALPDGKEKSNPYNVMNRIVTESRKYGLALFLASQRLDHYSQEILANIYTKIILEIKPTDYKSAATALGVKEDFLADTFSTQKGRPAIIETSGNKFSYLIEDLKIA